MPFLLPFWTEKFQPFLLRFVFEKGKITVACMHTIKAYGEVKVVFHTRITSALDLHLGFVSELQTTNSNLLKIKLSLFSTKHPSMKICGGGGRWGGNFTHSFNLGVCGVWSASRQLPFYSAERRLKRRLGRTQPVLKL